METFVRKLRNRHWYLGLLVMLLSVASLMLPVARGQQATANVNGIVKDPNGTAIANAQVEITNVNTGVVTANSSNVGTAISFNSILSWVNRVADERVACLLALFHPYFSEKTVGWIVFSFGFGEISDAPACHPESSERVGADWSPKTVRPAKAGMISGSKSHRGKSPSPVA
jgi:4-amino-4-deoxy-L-arabinose transferase-like glycosyltransferase